MYCASCGSALTPNLTYCNKCGARVGANDVSKPEPAPEFLVGSMVTLFIFGLGVIIGLMATMKRGVGFEWNIILAVFLICFTLLVLMEGIFIYLLFRGRYSRDRKDATQLKEHTTNELTSEAAIGLPPHLDSVTEH